MSRPGLLFPCYRMGVRSMHPRGCSIPALGGTLQPHRLEADHGAALRYALRSGRRTRRRPGTKHETWELARSSLTRLAVPRHRRRSPARHQVHAFPPGRHARDRRPGTPRKPQLHVNTARASIAYSGFAYAGEFIRPPTACPPDKLRLPPIILVDAGSSGAARREPVLPRGDVPAYGNCAPHITRARHLKVVLSWGWVDGQLVVYRTSSPRRDMISGRRRLLEINRKFWATIRRASR